MGNSTYLFSPPFSHRLLACLFKIMSLIAMTDRSHSRFIRHSCSCTLLPISGPLQVPASHRLRYLLAASFSCFMFIRGFSICTGWGSDLIGKFYCEGGVLLCLFLELKKYKCLLKALFNTNTS